MKRAILCLLYNPTHQ